MQGARKWHALLAMSLLLITSSVQGNSEMQLNKRRTLLDVIVQVIGDSNNNREGGKMISRRYNEGATFSTDQDNQRLSSRERTALVTKSINKRPIEIFSQDPKLKDTFLQHFSEILSRDPSHKDKFIKHFTETLSRNPKLKDKLISNVTGPVTISAECNKQFHRLYHNTRDCIYQNYFMRCARMLTRLAMSPLCSQF
ncbi:ALK and LTK ligand 1 [Discoglossus pictus]